MWSLFVRWSRSQIDAASLLFGWWILAHCCRRTKPNDRSIQFACHQCAAHLPDICCRREWCRMCCDGRVQYRRSRLFCWHFSEPNRKKRGTDKCLIDRIGDWRPRQSHNVVVILVSLNRILWLMTETCATCDFELNLFEFALPANDDDANDGSIAMSSVSRKIIISHANVTFALTKWNHSPKSICRKWLHATRDGKPKKLFIRAFLLFFIQFFFRSFPFWPLFVILVKFISRNSNKSQTKSHCANGLR